MCVCVCVCVCNTLCTQIVEVPKMPDIELLHPAVLEKHLPQVLQQVDKVCYSTLEFLARLGL